MALVLPDWLVILFLVAVWYTIVHAVFLVARRVVRRIARALFDGFTHSAMRTMPPGLLQQLTGIGGGAPSPGLCNECVASLGDIQFNVAQSRSLVDQLKETIDDLRPRRGHQDATDVDFRVIPPAALTEEQKLRARAEAKAALSGQPVELILAALRDGGGDFPEEVAAPMGSPA
jgi:hypothetical protein